MQLLTMHKYDVYASFIEGFHIKCGCITLWNDSDNLQQLSSPFFNYTAENRVPKYTNPLSR